MRRIERDNQGIMKAGQDLVVAGFAGLAGTKVIAEARFAQMETWFSGDYLETIINADDILTEENLVFWQKLGATEWEPSGEGGIFKTLWDLSGAYELGIAFMLRCIPLRQETIELCERLELNPYRLYARGCHLLVADNGGQLVRNLARQNIPASVIGTVSSSIAREILSTDGRGFLDRPQMDELKKVVPDYIFI